MGEAVCWRSSDLDFLGPWNRAAEDPTEAKGLPGAGAAWGGAAWGGAAGHALSAHTSALTLLLLPRMDELAWQTALLTFLLCCPFARTRPHPLL